VTGKLLQTRAKASVFARVIETFQKKVKRKGEDWGGGQGKRSGKITRTEGKGGSHN